MTEIEQLPEYVYYACYGSNLYRDRFMRYIEGGNINGNGLTYMGARDNTPPVDDRVLELPHELYFSGYTGAWQGGGGVAYIDMFRSIGHHTLARAYKITSEQFEDVVAQENKLDSVRIARRAGTIALLDPLNRPKSNIDAYNQIIECGEVEGTPVLSFTTNREGLIDYPRPAYLNMIGRGLIEATGMAVNEVAEYLADKAGIKYFYTQQEVREVISHGI